ncbi:MAG: radical SAM protein, partial [Bradymonadaceae bacterium]
FSGVTDCYQPLESSYEVTRDCLEVCEAIGNPVCIVTKSALVRRDTDLLASIAEDVGARVCVSIPFAEDGRARKIEPTAAAVSQRFRTIEHLSEAGIQTGVAVAPVIPGLNDSAIPDILDRAAEAGASTAFMTLLRLPRQVEPVFEERLRNQFPDRADKVMNTLREMRGGDLNAPDFGDRMVGEGPRWQTIESLFELHCRKYGLRASQRPDVQSLEPAGSVQASLFDR